MAIGTPLSLGSFATASATSGAIASTPNPVTAADLIILIHYFANSAATVSGLPTDTAGNVYTRVTVQTTAPAYEVFISPGSLAMASASSISCNFNSSAGRHGLAALTLAGMIPSLGVWDPRPLTTTGTATSANSLTGTPIGASNMFNLGFMVTAAAPGTFTPGGSWTAVGGSAATAIILPAYQVTNSFTATLVWAPGWVNSILYRSATMAFKGLPAANTSRQQQLSMTGMGV